MNINDEEVVSAYYVSVIASGGEKKALITINEFEVPAFLRDCFSQFMDHFKIEIEIKNYKTTKAEFLQDLKKLTSEVQS